MNTFLFKLLDYTHCIGRTGRAGKSGTAITFLTQFRRFLRSFLPFTFLKTLAAVFANESLITV